VQPLLLSDKHCFECYGYDIIIDDNLKPWLIEVNASPSMSATTANDKAMKHAVINDVINLVVPPEFPDSRGAGGRREEELGGFRLIVDDTMSTEKRTSKIRK
jgi:tubulin polyglutamylase TTLL1